MGLRLAGRSWNIRDELLTEGVSLGAIQVPPEGQPIITFVEHQTTGGYPKIANVISADLPASGQLRPRDEVRFERVSMARALELLREQEARLCSIDLNCDMGELEDAAVEEATDAAYHVGEHRLRRACGLGRDRWRARSRLALRHGVTVGAHPGYPDRANFGRVEMTLTAGGDRETVFAQIDGWPARVPQIGARQAARRSL